MKMQEVRKRAKQKGVKARVGITKRDLIRAIQKAEGNPQCFDAGEKDCPELECCWRGDCQS